MPRPDAFATSASARRRGNVGRSHARSVPRIPCTTERSRGRAARPWIFQAIGTFWSIETARELSPRTAGRIAGLIEEFDRAFSRFRPDSLVTRMAYHAGTFEIPASGRPLLDFYRDLYLRTGGAVTPLIGGSLERLGYDACYTLRRKGEGLAAPPWDDVMDWDGHTLDTRRPIGLDLGAAGKGRLVDLVAEELGAAGHTDYTVDASGDLVHSGASVERVGLEDPRDPRTVIGVARIGNGALAASATNRRSWGKGLHHVIDPVSGEPVGGTLATWISTRSAMVADGLATALFLRPATPELLDAAYGSWEWVRMARDGSVFWSAGFDGEVFHR